MSSSITFLAIVLDQPSYETLRFARILMVIGQRPKLIALAGRYAINHNLLEKSRTIYAPREVRWT